MSSLGHDLSTIRKRQHLSVEQVHEKTKIPIRVLRAIENDTISELEENETYVRSYIRSYAKALKIEDDLVVRALDQVDEGSYSGLLIQERTERPKSGYDEKSPPESEKRSSDMVHDHAPDEPGKRDPEASRAGQKIPPPPSVDSVDWADMGKKFTPLESNSRMWIGVTLVLIIIVTVLFFVVYQNSPSSINIETGNPSTASPQPGVVPDSLQVELNETTSTEAEDTLQPESMTTLPDTLTMLVYAAYDKLEPVRVYTDVMESINPYWIEHGEAYRFNFVNEIRIRGQYSRMELLLNGHSVENFRDQFYNPETRMLEINRNYFEESNKWLQAPQDTVTQSFPAPDSIRDRPSFF